MRYGRDSGLRAHVGTRPNTTMTHMDMVHIHDAHSVDALRERSDPKDPETPVRPVPSSTLCGGPGLFFWGSVLGHMAPDVMLRFLVSGLVLTLLLTVSPHYRVDSSRDTIVMLAMSK